MDSGFRRLRYTQYADDFLLGFCGPRSEAEEIKRRIGEFLGTLKLTLSDQKTLITHARTGKARFLSYEISAMHNDRKRDKHGRRSINGMIYLQVPRDVSAAKMKPYLKNGKPAQRMELTKDGVFSIVKRYQQEYRGIVEYYRMAHNLSSALRRLRWVMACSLVKTLALKLRISCNRVFRRFGTTIQDQGRTRKVLQVRVERQGKKPLVAQWGGISLARKKEGSPE